LAYLQVYGGMLQAANL